PLAWADATMPKIIHQFLCVMPCRVRNRLNNYSLGCVFVDAFDDERFRLENPPWPPRKAANGDDAGIAKCVSVRVKSDAVHLSGPPAMMAISRESGAFHWP